MRASVPTASANGMLPRYINTVDMILPLFSVFCNTVPLPSHSVILGLNHRGLKQQ